MCILCIDNCQICLKLLHIPSIYAPLCFAYERDLFGRCAVDDLELLPSPLCSTYSCAYMLMKHVECFIVMGTDHFRSATDHIDRFVWNKWRFCNIADQIIELRRKWPAVTFIIPMRHDVRGLFYWHGLTWISAWISNQTPSKAWDEITYLFPNFNWCPRTVNISKVNFTSKISAPPETVFKNMGQQMSGPERLNRLEHSAWIRRLGGSSPPQVETFSVSKALTLSQEQLLCVENECCGPRTVNISNVNFTRFVGKTSYGIFGRSRV